ncbi:MAG: BatA domain-containing protein [Phycisphaerae bacterium]
MVEPVTLASFVSPGLFYAGACAVAVPVVIHLLARRRFRRIRWAAIDFLVQAERRNRRRIRMEEWVLLALRCLAVILIAALVSRPFLTPTGLAAAWGGARRIERVFVLDDSFSMGYRAEDGTWFDRAKLGAKRVLDVVRRETPDDTVTIVKMSAVDKPVVSGAYLDDAGLTDLLARLDALSPSKRSISVAAAMQSLADLLGRAPGIVNAAIYVFSDFQRCDWAPAESGVTPGEGASLLLAPLAAWAKGVRGMHLTFVNVGDEGAANTAVKRVTIPSGRLVAGMEGTVRAVVVNHSDRPVDDLQVDLTVGHAARPPERIGTLGPWQSVSVDLDVGFPRAGWESVRVELPEDALPADDVRYLGADVAGAVGVLIVDGEPSADSFDDEVSLLATALRPEGELPSGIDLAIVDEVDLEDANLDGFHVVILANVHRVSDPAVDALERFVRGGGGLIIFLGDQVDPSLYNATLYRDGEGLLPAELGEIIIPAGEAHLVIVDALHPALRGLSQEGDPLGIGRVPFKRYFSCTPFGGPSEPLDSEEAEAGAARTTLPAKVLAVFDDAGEHPALVERSFGLGRTALVTTTSDKEWHYWPDHPTYLPVMIELVRHVARRGGGKQEQLVGSTIELRIDPALYEPDVIVRTPNYPAERELGVMGVPAADGRGLVLRWEQTDTAGLYQFTFRRRQSHTENEAGSASPAPDTALMQAPAATFDRLVAVNVDPREGDLSMANEEEIRRAAGGVPFDYIKGIDRLGGRTGEGRIEYWRPVLFATVAVLLCEQFLAWRWGRRR